MKSNLQNTKNKIKPVEAHPLGEPLPKKNTQRGITLVALIITVIILLILAMVSIRLIMNGGIIDRAERGMQAYSEAEIKEKIGTAYQEYQMSQYSNQITFEEALVHSGLNGATVSEDGLTVSYQGKDYPITENGVVGNAKTVIKVLAGETAPSDSNAEYTSNGKKAIVPSGYTVSNVEGETDIDTGLVIKKDGNEWVWIPVSESDFTAMFETANDDGWTMDGTSVKTKYKSKGDIITGKNRVSPGDKSSYREPDVLNHNDYDKKTSFLSQIGVESYENLAIKLRDDYKKMMDSLRMYGGFYIGRYEISNVGTQKNQASLTNKNWYDLYKKCRDIESTSNAVVSTMIFGCQWDQVCKFISTAKDANGNSISLTDSRKYGNYKNSIEPANTGNYSSGSKKNTGSNEAWKTNNIYDLAGNCYEWSQEAYNNAYRTIRGGVYHREGDSVSITSRGLDLTTRSAGDFSTRPIIYIK